MAMPQMTCVFPFSATLLWMQSYEEKMNERYGQCISDKWQVEVELVF
jgi:hypothetical protein